MAKLLVSDKARKAFATLRRAFNEVNHTLPPKFSQEPKPTDWEDYIKGIGPRLVNYKQAYDSNWTRDNIKIPLLATKHHILTRRHLLQRRFSSSAQLLETGSILRQARVFTKGDVVEYSQVCGDWNPVHLDSEQARNAGFQDCVVHGMLVASLFPRIIASQFPGAIYASQSLHFKLPVYIEEEVVGEVQAIHVRKIKDKFLVKFATKCTNNGDLIVIDGEATALLPGLAMEQHR